MRPEPEDFVGAWAHFERSLTMSHVGEFLDQVSTVEWVIHANYFNLFDELEFIERNGLDSLLLADEFEFPIMQLDDGASAITDAGKLLREIPYLRRQAMRLLHLKCRDYIRDRLGLPPLAPIERDRFMVANPKWPLPTGSVLLIFNQRQRTIKCTDEDLAPALALLKTLYPEVHAYFAASAKAQEQGYEPTSSVGYAPRPMSIAGSIVVRELPADRDLPDLALVKLIRRLAT